MKITYKKIVGLVLCLSMIVFSSANIVSAAQPLPAEQTKINPHETALTAEEGIDKTPFIEKIKAMEKEGGYDEIYNKIVTPDQPDFEEKFKKFAKKLDDLNKKHYYKSSFDVAKIVYSQNIFAETSITMGGGNGDGTNALNPTNMISGDICLINNPGYHLQGAIQHASMMDKRLYFNENSPCYLTAQPDLGVIYETTKQYKTGYDEAWILRVNGLTTTQALAALDKVDVYLGKPYLWYIAKASTEYWYCSKLPWYGYNYANNKDIDYDGGYWCLPADIFLDLDLSLKSYFN